MKKAILVLFMLFLTQAVTAQYDRGVISPYIEKPSNPLDYIFTTYAGGAADGSYYYHFPTNITGYFSSGRNYKGECVYYWPEANSDKEISEDVVIYRGNNSAAAFNNGTAFTAMRTATPCFDGRWGEVSEQANRTWAYGGGDVNYVAFSAKYYILVNRVRARWVNGAPEAGDWFKGDFREVFIGAKDSLTAAASVGAGTSGRCRGEAVSATHPEYCAHDAFAWKWNPLIEISTINGVTYETLTPIVAAPNAATSQLIWFNNMPSGTVLFGFMPFGRADDFPNRTAAVAITDPTGIIRPQNAVLYYRSGGVYVPATNGVMTQVPDDVTASLGFSTGMTDLEYDPVLADWFIYGTRSVSTNAGCNDGSPGQGAEFLKRNLATGAVTGFWASQNDLGRFTIDAHFIGSDEFILYSSTDRRCVNDPIGYQADTGLGKWRSMEIMVRNRTFAPQVRIVSGDGITVGNGSLYTFPSTTKSNPISRAFTIYNDGNATLTISNPSTLVSGAGWSLILEPPASIAPGSSGAFRVRLLSATAGTYSGSVTIQNNSATNPFSFSLRGTVN